MARRRGGYEVGWTLLAGSCLALGAAVTVLVDTVGALVLMAVMAAAVGCLWAVVVDQDDRPGRAALRTAPVVLLGLTGVSGLAIALGPVTIALVAVLVLTGIPVAWRIRSRRGQVEDTTEPPPPVAEKPKPATVVPDSTAAICWTWRASFTALHDAHGLDERLRIVALRQHCLDELARREPEGFHKWLDAGARAASDPSRYVCARKPDTHGSP